MSEVLQRLSTELSEHDELLSKVVCLPIAQYPVHTQSNVVEQLLATQLSLPAEEWVEYGQQHAKEASSNQVLSDLERRELWQWAPGAANAEARKQKWGADYTLAEVQAGIENVETGLTRELIEPPEDDDEEGDESDEEEDEEEAMDIDATAVAGAPSVSTAGPGPSVPPMPLDALMKFMSTAKAG